MIENFSEVLHELKTPISVIKGYSDILANNPDLDEETRQSYIEKIYQKSLAAEILLTDLSIRLKDDEFGDDISYEICDFNSLVRTCLDDFEGIFKLSNLETSLYTDAGSLMCRIDIKKMTSVLENLIQNAVKYTPKGGRIYLSSTIVKSNGKELLFIIYDNGNGLSQLECDKIFNRYYTSKENMLHSKNLGLGLHICRTIIEKHKGKIWAQSEKQKGMAVYITLPLNMENEDEQVDDEDLAEPTLDELAIQRDAQKKMLSGK